MKPFAYRFASLIEMLVIAGTLFAVTISARADTWRGTAPICRGKCLAGETQIAISDYGDGGYCVSGHKVLCRNNQPLCPVRETQTHCAGVVMICDNGFHESPTGNWHSCGTYACGACVGISSTGPFGVDTCKQGFVWREAIANDHVCVKPATRSQAASDNAAAASRRAGGGAYGPDTCKPGLVWREVVPSDHVCVPPATRAAAAADNRVAMQRRVGN
jgi:hypothetical protein